MSHPEPVYVYVLLDVLLEVAGQMQRAVVSQFDVDHYASEAGAAAAEYAKAGQAAMNEIIESKPRIYVELNM